MSKKKEVDKNSGALLTLRQRLPLGPHRTAARRHQVPVLPAHRRWNRYGYGDKVLKSLFFRKENRHQKKKVNNGGD